MSICIECAVAHHEFREILVSPEDGTAGRGGIKLREAWIDGKRYRLDHVALYHVPCDQCRRVKSSLFVSADD